MEKIKISLPIIVEGRYDKSTLSGFVDATIITTDGFSVFNNKEKQALLRRLCARGAIVMTDSDGAGKQIRSFLLGILPNVGIYNLHIPKIKGKESRKTHGSAEGTLGVEGMSREVLERLLLPFCGDAPSRSREITKLDFYEDGLSGGDNSAARRDALASLASLPSGMSAKALLEAMNLLFGYDEYKEMIEKIDI